MISTLEMGIVVVGVGGGFVVVDSGRRRVGGCRGVGLSFILYI
jgi:hypothetical protein